MKRIVIGLLVAIGIVAALTILGCGLAGNQPQVITWEPYPTPEIRIVEVIKEIPVISDGNNDHEVDEKPLVIYSGRSESLVDPLMMVAPTVENGGFMISIVGEQLLCARDWKMSNVYGPVGSLEANPDRPLTFNDLQAMVEREKKAHEQKAEDMH